MSEGRSYVVTSHGRPVARISPPADAKPLSQAEKQEEWFAHLDRRPAMNSGPWTREELHED